jgi:hypothetical protein
VKLPPELQSVLDKVRAEAGVEDPQTLQEVANVISDTSRLTARAVMGEDVSSEFGHIKATVLGFGEHLRQVVSVNLMTFFTTIVSNIIARALMIR